MHRAKKPLITDLNEHLTCKLCKGYFIEATTIIECLHSFCRSCIVKYLQKNKYCPVCDVQVHKSKPLLNIRPDRTLQDVVFKLVPRLLQNELHRRRDFYQAHPEIRPTINVGENYQHLVSSDESISLAMCYYGCKESVRYLQCPATLSVGHLQKLIRAKYGLFDNHHVDILYNQDCLNSYLTLMDVAYIYSWRRKEPLEITYRIYEFSPKKLKLDVKDESSDVVQNNNNWKEVQLRISENGEMSIIQDEVLELVNNNNYKSEVVTVVDDKVKELPEVTEAIKCVTEAEPSVTTNSAIQTTTTVTTKNSVKNSEKKIEEETKSKEVKKPPEVVQNDKGVKRKSDTKPEPEKQPKQTILNHTINLHNLSNNHPLKKHSQSKTETDRKEEILAPKLSDTTETPKPCYMPKPIINVPKPCTSNLINSKNEKVQQTCSNVNKTENKPLPPVPLPPPVKNIKTKASTPMGYKTLRDPPKSWNSQIAKANINKPIGEPKYNDLKNVRPPKFFKMRNNLPRYLGNPASGVKPMYQVHVSPDKDKEKPEVTKGEIKKHSIVKIDPKTLKPISEKAPETTSLTSNNTELKINTSSVSITNPLKHQNSPKGDRKSPKTQPHSPKTTNKNTAPPPVKRDKQFSLNFTPSNPFIPNLASPTVSPNQFLYPTGPPGFPSYDPRVMAAYHNLLYGQRMAFPPPGLSMDLNSRKNFDLPAPTSPKLGGMPQPHSPQPPLKLLPPTDQLGIQSPSRTSITNSTNHNSSTFKHTSAPKKNNKESTTKSEKSLQNAVEKLTQNRVKEIKETKNEAAVDKTKSSDENKKDDPVKKPESPVAPPTPENATKDVVQVEKDSNSNEEKTKADNQSEKKEEAKEVNSNSNGEMLKVDEPSEKKPTVSEGSSCKDVEQTK